MRSFLIGAALALAACHPPANPTEAAAVASGAAQTGVAAPAGSLHAADGRAVALAELWPAHQETVLVFYRGFY
ncbi:MAG TPA: hypothetical protein VL463_06085 [Kofleriaceae bacterium]|jgi:hypothetical protein|nr:hypothetical protein [Kofleriaceae bacterium]